MPLLVSLLVSVAASFAAPALPVDFSTDPGWVAQPTFLGNPAQHPQISVENGAVVLRVAEPGRGMKFELPLQPFASDQALYLVLTYRARNLGPGYTIWVSDEVPGGHQILAAGDLRQDGEWHTIALEMWPLGVKGAVKAILTQVECLGETAELTFRELSLADEPPQGAQTMPEARVAAPEYLLRFADLAPSLKAQPGWLAARATEHSVAAEDGSLHLSAAGTDLGMKWSADLPAPLDLSRYRFASLRYRATGTAPWGDYALWLGSGPGGMPDDWSQPAAQADLQADGHWHVLVVPLDKSFVATNLAVEVSSLAGRGDLWLDTVRFTSQRPLVPVTDALDCSEGWQASRLDPSSISPLDLSGLTDDTMAGWLRTLGLAGWLPSGHVTVLGIPFNLAAGPLGAVSTPPDRVGEVTLPVGRAAGELYLLVAGRLPARDLSGMLGGGPMIRFANPERCVFRVTYDDGVCDEIFPVCVSSGANEMRRGVEAYALTGLRPVPVRSVTLDNRMPSARFSICALTANLGAPITHERPPLTLPALVPAGPEPPVAASIRPAGDAWVVDDGLLRLVLSTGQGLQLTSLVNRCTPRLVTRVTPGPLFEVATGDARVDSARAAVGEPRLTSRAGLSELRLPFDASGEGVPVRGELVVEVGGEAGVRMWLDAWVTGAGTVRPEITFPLVRGLQLGDAPATWYLWGRKGGIISDQPTRQRQVYGGEYPLQVADAFSPDGGGIALLTRDTQDVYRYWGMEKGSDGITWRLDTIGHNQQPGEAIEVAPVVLRAHTGDWRRALGLYREWCRTWYQPRVARKDWFRKAFYYQQVFAWSQLYDGPGKPWKMAEIIERYRDLMGCLDYLHIFDFGESRVYGRVGDYNHYEELGGLPTLQSALRLAQDQGVRVGLYMEGYLCDRQGVWGRGNVEPWGMRLETGRTMEYTPGATEYMMCPATAAWREHLASTYARVESELHPDGMYIDQFGFVDTWKTCWAPDHGHPVPWGPIRGERDTLAAIRDAVPPTVATLTEETPNDTHSVLQDGALTYSVAFNDPALAPHRVNLFRFQFPDFKAFQLVSYNPFLEGSWQLLKYPFFNGDGYWLHHSPTEYCDEARDFMRTALRVMHQYADCFAGDDVEPLVPTLAPGVFANRFSASGRTVWTLLNTNPRTWRGPVLQVPEGAPMLYTDALAGRPVEVVRGPGGQSAVELELGPGAVGCIAARPDSAQAPH